MVSLIMSTTPSDLSVGPFFQLALPNASTKLCAVMWMLSVAFSMA